MVKSNIKYEAFLGIILLLYSVSPLEFRFVLLPILLFIVFKKPYLGLLAFIVTPIFDANLLIPVLSRSISLIILPISLFSILLYEKFNTHNLKVIPLLLHAISISFAVYLGYNKLSVDERIGFSDPFSGISYLFAAFFVYLILRTKRNILIEFRDSLWLVPIMMLAGIILNLGDLNLGERFYGNMGDPNYYSKYLILSIILTFAIVHRKWARVVLLFILSLFVVLSLSRTAILILLLIYFISIVKNFKLNNIITMVSILLILVAVVLNFTVTSVLYERFSQKSDIVLKNVKMDNELDILTSGRTYMLSNALKQLTPNKLPFYFGTGIGTSSAYNKDLFGESYAVHNAFLEIILDIGILGAILLIIFYKSILKQAAKYSDKVYKNKSVMYSFILYFILFNLTLSGFWTKQNVSIMICMIPFMHSPRTK